MDGACAGGEKMRNVQAWTLAMKSSASSLFVMRSVAPLMPRRTSPELAVVGGTATLWIVGMTSGDGRGDLVLTRFLGWRWLVEVVVCGVVLCQHPAPKITLCG
jgi:hypothetical protein